MRKENGIRRAFRRNRLLFSLLIFIIVAAVSAAVIFFYCANYYENAFHPGTSVNGVSLSGLSLTEAKAAMQKQAEGYNLIIHGRDGMTEILTAQDIGLTYEDNGLLDRLYAARSKYSWAFDGQAVLADIGASYDRKKTAEAVEKMDCFDPLKYVAASNAHIAEENGIYVLIPEVEGTEIDIEKFWPYLLTSIESLSREMDLEANDCYVHPTVYQTEPTLKERMDTLNLFLRTNVSYAFGDNVEVLNRDTVAPLLVDNGKEVYVDDKALLALMDDWSKKYETYGVDFRFMTYYGVEVTVPAGGDYGWAFDHEGMMADVKKAIETGATGQRDVAFTHQGQSWANNGLGECYIEISISQQRLWCYRGDEIVMETPVVTGTMGESDTHCGCFNIDYMESPAVLGVLDLDGYSSPVNYFLPFNGDQGVHDAPWRDEFGGDVYTYYGSHGCVNVPEDKMEAIYKNMHDYDAVVVWD